MSALWTREQHEWLQAMGHTVWAMGDAPAANDLPPPAAEAPRPAPREARPAPPAAGHERLLQALLRVAGDADALAALGIDAASLRGNAAAKRALWPRLRALRRGRRP